MTQRVNVTLPDHVFALVEEARMREPRSAFVARMLESALSEAKGQATREQAAPSPVGSGLDDPEPVRVAAPSRAPEPQPRLVAASGVRKENDGAMAPPPQVPAPLGSNPEPPPKEDPEPDPEPEPAKSFQLPKIAPRRWGR